jgi:hypothetical protein
MEISKSCEREADRVQAALSKHFWQAQERAESLADCRSAVRKTDEWNTIERGTVSKKEHCLYINLPRPPTLV